MFFPNVYNLPEHLAFQGKLTISAIYRIDLLAAWKCSNFITKTVGGIQNCSIPKSAREKKGKKK